MVLPFIALAVSIVAVSFFGLSFLWSLSLAHAVDKRSDMNDESRYNIAIMAKGYTPLANVPAKQTTAINHNLKTIKHMDRKKGNPVLIAVHRNRSIREFHRSVVASLAVGLFGVIILYHLANITGVLYLTRAADARLIDPWRLIGFISIATGMMHAFVGMACQHHTLSLLMLASQGVASRVMLGLATFFPPTSGNFWILAITGLVFGLISFWLLWFHRSKHVAGNSSTVGYVTYFAIPVALAIHFGLLLLSYETYAVLTFESTVILNALADALLFLVPTLYVLSLSYYKGSLIWPLLPHAVYADYGLGHYWKLEAKPDLISVKKTILTNMGVAAQSPAQPSQQDDESSANDDVESGATKE